MIVWRYGLKHRKGIKKSKKLKLGNSRFPKFRNSVVLLSHLVCFSSNLSRNCVKFEIWILKIARGDLRSQHNAEFGLFTLFNRRRQKNVPVAVTVVVLLSYLVFLETANQPVLGDERYNCITCRWQNGEAWKWWTTYRFQWKARQDALRKRPTNTWSSCPWHMSDAWWTSGIMMVGSSPQEF